MAVQAINAAKAALAAQDAVVASICAQEAMEFAFLVPRGHSMFYSAYDYAVQAQKYADSL